MYYLTPSFFSSSHIQNVVIKRTNSCKKKKEEEELDIKWGEMKDTWTFIKTVSMVYLKSK